VRAVPFQVADCAALPFRPRVSIRAGRAGRTARGRLTPLTVEVHQRAGDARLRRVRVELPRALGLQLGAARSGRCPVADRAPAVGACERSTTVGWATVRSPLFGGELRGPIQAATGSGVRSARVTLALRGAVALDLHGILRVASSGRTMLTLEDLPDLPLSRLAARFHDRRGGVIRLRQALCTVNRSDRRVQVATEAQSGRASHARPVVMRGGCSG
jgi:hypothetical protein